MRNRFTHRQFDPSVSSYWIKTGGQNWDCPFNVTKTQYIIFRTRGKIINNDSQLCYNANEPGQPNDESLIYTLDRVHDNPPDKNSKSYKLLGVYLDEYLSFNQHYNILSNKLSKSLLLNLLSQKTLRLLYFALFYPHINYCPIVLNCTTKKNEFKNYKRKQFELSQNLDLMPILNIYSVKIEFKLLRTLFCCNQPFSCTRSRCIPNQTGKCILRQNKQIFFERCCEKC